MSTTKNGVILNTFLPLCSLSLLELERFLDVLRMTKSFISLTVNCRVDINHPLLTGWREGRSPSAKANYARKFSKSKSSKGEYFPSMGYCQQSGIFTQLKTRLLYVPRLRIQLFLFTHHRQRLFTGGEERGEMAIFFAGYYVLF